VKVAGAFQQQFLDKLSKKSKPTPLTTAGRVAASNQFRDILSGNSDGRCQGGQLAVFIKPPEIHL
jgi:hypothetical protein